MFKSFVARAAKAVAVVIHDPKVDRSAKFFAGLVVVRLIIAAGFSAETAQIVANHLPF
jgi:hypothetical protein